MIITGYKIIYIIKLTNLAVFCDDKTVHTIYDTGYKNVLFDKLYHCVELRVLC